LTFLNKYLKRRYRITRKKYRDKSGNKGLHNMKIYASNFLNFVYYNCWVEAKKMEIEFSIGFKDLNASYPGEQDLKCLIKTFDEWSSLRSQRPYYPDTLDEGNRITRKKYRDKSGNKEGF
jgi:hypothetical protein